MYKWKWILCLLLGLQSISSMAAGKQDCQKSGDFAICMVRPGPFQHDYYILTLKNVVIFQLADDYAEDILLRHKVPEGPALEFEVSGKPGTVVEIKGGCVPVNQKNVEVARICNITWGGRKIIANVRFEL